MQCNSYYWWWNMISTNLPWWDCSSSMHGFWVLRILEAAMTDYPWCMCTCMIWSGNLNEACPLGRVFLKNTLLGPGRTMKYLSSSGSRSNSKRQTRALYVVIRKEADTEKEGLKLTSQSSSPEATTSFPSVFEENLNLLLSYWNFKAIAT